jgi:glycosyltransferase involved in cell wall biosynthesis
VYAIVPEPPADTAARVTVVFPVLNEAENLPAALACVSWATQIFVVDSGSTDATREIAHDVGATVVHFDYPAADGVKKKAWSLATLPFATEWVLFLDADERVTTPLRDEILAVLASPGRDGYYLDREMIFRGRPLRSYRPDWNLRLFRHSLTSIEDLGMADLPGTGDNEIHEHFQLQGSVGFLRAPLLHDDYRGIGPWIDRHNRYATWEAHLYARLRAEPLGVDPRRLRDPIKRNRLLRRVWVRLPARPLLRFCVWYFGKRAFRDGMNGLLYSTLMAWYELLIGLKLAEIDG